MERKKQQFSLKTYGHKSKQKNVRNRTTCRPNDSPLVTWNQHINRSDSFDKLFTTTKEPHFTEEKENSGEYPTQNVTGTSSTATTEPCSNKSETNSFSQFFKTSRNTSINDHISPTPQHHCRSSIRYGIQTFVTPKQLLFGKGLSQRSSTPYHCRTAQTIAGPTSGQLLPFRTISPERNNVKPNFAVEAFKMDELSKTECDILTKNKVQSASFCEDASLLSPVDFVSPISEKETDPECDSVDDHSEITSAPHNEDVKKKISITEISLMSLCNQPEILNFEECFPSSCIKKCRKVGEGTYGEVFEITIKSESVILKVVPIEGDFEVNGAIQKPFKEIETEALMTKELSDLRINGTCSTFIELIETYCIKGEYPKLLIDEWQRYHRQFKSENVNPAEVFDADQLFMVFVYKNGGTALEHYKLAIALAIAEEQLHFEHRDLHWGNVLITKTSTTSVHFQLSGKVLNINSEGVSICIIDYSLSRMQKDGQQVMYTNLAEDKDLFTCEGDYQFEVYRQMKKLNNNNWHMYNPKTNLFWLNYIIKKLLGMAKCKYGKRTEQKQVIEQLQFFQSRLLMYESAMEFVTKEILPIFPK